MSKLYKAVDKRDREMSCFLVNDQGVAISSHCGNDNSEIRMNKENENNFIYDGIEEFKKTSH